MLNAEKYKKEITAIMNEGDYFAITTNNPNALRHCNGLKCEDCVFGDNDYHDCHFPSVKWLLSEYKESVRLSKLEYELLKFWNDKEFKYIARDSNDAVFVYREKPSKKSEVWGSIYEHRVLEEFDKSFLFVKWEDKEPTLIKEVLNNCEVIEDD